MRLGFSWVASRPDFLLDAAGMDLVQEYSDSLCLLEVEPKSDNEPVVVFLWDDAGFLGSRSLHAVPHERNVEVERPESVDGQACEKVMRIASGFGLDHQKAVIHRVIDIVSELVFVCGPRPQRTRFFFS